MRVGKNNPLDAVARSCPHSVNMRLNRRTRIDNPALDDVRVGAVESQGRRVVGPHADDALGNGHARVSTGVTSPELGSQMTTGDRAWERRAFPLALAAMAMVVVID